MSAKSVIGAVVGFLTAHVSDLNNVAEALGSITGALPIDSQDKERINSVIADIKTSADNIASFLANNTVVGDSGTVEVKESDIVEALANFLNSDAGKAALRSALNVITPGAPPSPPSAEGNANG